MRADEALEELLEVDIEVAIHRVELVRDGIHRLSDNRVEHHLVHRAVLRRTGRAKLELVARERERRGAVAVCRIAREGRQGIDANLQLRVPRSASGGTRFNGLHHGAQFVAEEDGDDGGRCLVRAEAVVVAGAGRHRA